MRMADGGEGLAVSVLGERVAQAWREGKEAGRGAVKLSGGARLL
jgi:hypothetical protein